MATKKYERIAGSEDAMILREALDRISQGSLSASLEAKVDSLLEEMGKARDGSENLLERLIEAFSNKSDMPEGLMETLSQYTSSVQTMSADIKNLAEKMGVEKSTPTYSFKVERNASGLLVGITATPVKGAFD